MSAIRRSQPVNGGRKSYSFYAEARIPIFGPDNAIPGFHSLEFEDGIRFEEFLNNDSNVLVPKFGMRWQPLDEQLTLRVTWSEGYRQPSLEELFSAPISTLQGTRDPLLMGFSSRKRTLLSRAIRIFNQRILDPSVPALFTHPNMSLG